MMMKNHEIHDWDLGACHGHNSQVTNIMVRTHIPIQNVWINPKKKKQKNIQHLLLLHRLSDMRTYWAERK